MSQPPNSIHRDKVETEARARIIWGDSREEVIAFLVAQGIVPSEATVLVDEALKDREQTIRGIGLRKILIGIPLICLPFAAWFFFLAVHLIPVKVFALTVVAGLYGGWSLLSGLVMFVSPKSESGEIADK